MVTESEVLRAPHVLEYTYTRSVGPVIERFFAGLGEHRIQGIRGADGRVIVPPTEYDPQTSESLSDFVDVGDSGVVTTWAWTNEPRPGQPLDRPFAWALIRLDGADTAMLHVVDAGDESKMSTGMRVKVRWAADPVPDMAAIECFEPEDGTA
jgi:uncharacterized OB-fold protein